MNKNAGKVVHCQAVNTKAMHNVCTVTAQVLFVRRVLKPA